MYIYPSPDRCRTICAMSVPARPDIGSTVPPELGPAALQVWRPALMLFGALVAPMAAPFIGVLPSLAVLVLGPSIGPKIWPGRSRWLVLTSTFLAFGAFWLGPYLSMTGVAPLRSGWFVIPLCGP